MNKRFAIVALTALMVFVFAGMALADPFTGRPHTWRGEQIYRGEMKFRGDNADLTLESGSEITLTTAPRYTTTTLTWTAGTGYTVPSTVKTGAVYQFDISSATSSSAGGDNGIMDVGTAGVTIHIPTPTAVNHDTIFGLQKIDSGTTDAILYCAGLPIFWASSGTTNVSKEMDAQGDIVWLQLNYNGAVSVFAVNEYMH